MEPNIPAIAKQILYFSDSTMPEVKQAAYSLFAETWGRIPEEDQQNIEDHLEFILIKPINDPLYSNSAAFARVSPTMPTWKSWIMWYPLFPLSHKKEINIFCLAHELAHVHLLHPQRGFQMTTGEEKEFKHTAEDEAHSQTAIWGILQPAGNTT